MERKYYDNRDDRGNYSTGYVHKRVYYNLYDNIFVYSQVHTQNEKRCVEQFRRINLFVFAKLEEVLR